MPWPPKPVSSEFDVFVSRKLTLAALPNFGSWAHTGLAAMRRRQPRSMTASPPPPDDASQPKADMIFALAASKPLGKRGGVRSFAADARVRRHDDRSGHE